MADEKNTPDPTVVGKGEMVKRISMEELKDMAPSEPAAKPLPKPVVADESSEEDEDEGDEEEEIEVTAPVPAALTLGKLYKGDQFPALKTPDMVERERLEQEKYNHPESVPIEVYFSVRGISDVGAQAARRRSTSVQQATMEKWDEIFKASF